MAYYSLYNGIKQKDNPMVLRHLSIDLYDKYTKKETTFDLKERISDVSIYDCNVDVR